MFISRTVFFSAVFIKKKNTKTELKKQIYQVSRCFQMRLLTNEGSISVQSDVLAWAEKN